MNNRNKGGAATLDGIDASSVANTGNKIDYTLYLSEYGNTLTVQEAAQILRLNEQTVRKELDAGRCPGRKFGRTWVIPKPLFVAYLLGEKW